MWDTIYFLVQPNSTVTLLYLHKTFVLDIAVLIKINIKTDC